MNSIVRYEQSKISCEMDASYVDPAVYAEIVRKISQGISIGSADYRIERKESTETYCDGLCIGHATDYSDSSVWWYDLMRDKIIAAREERIVDNAIIHGSYGDFTNTAFSDLEITLLLGDDVISSKGKCKALKRWLSQSLNPLILEIDPLQHHGPFFLWSSLLKNYSESILPVKAYQNSWAVIAPLNLKFFSSGFLQQRVKFAFNVTISSIRDYNNTFFKKGVNPYSIKRLLSNIMLLPAFFYQANGVNISKRDAIIKMTKLDIPSISRVLNLASEYRENWKRPPAWLGKLRGNVNTGTIPSNTIDLLCVSIYRDKQLNKSVEDLLLPGIPGFCDAIERLYEDYENK